MKKGKLQIKLAKYHKRKKLIKSLEKAHADRLFVESATDEELASKQHNKMSREAELARINIFIDSANKWLAEHPV